MMNESNPNVIINDGTNAAVVKPGTGMSGGGPAGTSDGAVTITTSPSSADVTLLRSIALLLKLTLIEHRVQTAIMQVGLSTREQQDVARLRIDETVDLEREINSPEL